MRFARFEAGLVAAVLAVSLAGCGGKDDSSDLPTLGGESSAPTTSTPTSAASTPASTAPPAGQPTTSTQKYGPLTLVLDHTAPPPENAVKALEAYESYERSAHKSQATNVMDPGVAKYGAGQAVQIVRDSVKDQKAKGVRTGGVISVKVKLVRASAAVAGFSGCYDQSKSLLVRANGTSFTGPLTKQNPQLQFTVIVANVGSLWRVTEYNLKAGKC